MMGKKKSQFPIILMWISLLLSACAHETTTTRTHHNYLERKDKIKSVAVMPPSVNIAQIAVGKKDPLLEAMDMAERSLKLTAEEHIKAKQFDVKDARLSEKDLDPELKLELTRIKEKFSEIGGKILESYQSKSKEFNFSLGEDVNQFADRAEVDALVFMSGVGWRKSGGKVVQEYLKSFSQAMITAAITLGHAYAYKTPSSRNGAVIQIALVDGDTGEVLWYNFAANTCDPTQEECMRSLVNSTLGRFPPSE